jgi:hypothetical protein
MKLQSIKRSAALPLALVLLFSAPILLHAQMDTMSGPPKVLVIDREFLKPGKAGGLHEKSESNFIRASAAAKTKNYYFGMDSLSGPSRSLFFFAYPSFEAWEKQNQTDRKNATLTAAIDHAFNADGELLSSYEQSAWTLRPELSLNTGNLVGKRYMEITQIIVRPGHNQEIEELAKLYVDTYKKAVPTANWAAFELMYGVTTNGSSGGAFLFITTLKSLSEADRELGENKQFMDALGANGKKRLAELSAGAETITTNLFEFNPKISYPPDEWIKAEPDFWKPKPAAAPAPKPATTPAP